MFVTHAHTSRAGNPRIPLSMAKIASLSTFNGSPLTGPKILNLFLSLSPDIATRLLELLALMGTGIVSLLCAENGLGIVDSSPI